MLPGFHPLVADWFEQTFDRPTDAQQAAWAEIARGEDTLIAAPTGSGKTLAAFLWSINELVEAALSGNLKEATQVVYVSPLKALGNDINTNLEGPLSGIYELAAARGIDLGPIRTAVRSGDTPAAQRARMLRKPPHILVTTPESLYILLTAAGSREYLKTARTVIVDEIHAVAADKRGAHLALTLERLDRLTGSRCQRVGLSATQKPIEEIGRLLVGASRVTDEGKPDCRIVNTGHRRDLDLSVWVPGQPLGPVASNEAWAEVYDEIARITAQHRTTLVFVHTRRLAERVAHQLSARLGEGKVGTHHGSLSRFTRLDAERRLKSAELPVVVATASLELGIDIGHIDVVCHIGAPRSVATLLQRVGRSGHWLGSVPKGVVFALTRDELVQSAAAVRAVRMGELDRVLIPDKPLDILAQQIVAIAAAEKIGEDELWNLVTRSYHYRNLSRKEFDEIVEMLAEGVSVRNSRRSAHLHRDAINHTLRGRRGARLAAITSGGAIPDTADYDVIEDPEQTFVGKVNEDFAIESHAGDIFLLGNTSWKIRRVESGRLRVENARGAPPNIPFWIGEAPARTRELSDAVSQVREKVESKLDSQPEAVRWLIESCAVDEAGAVQIFDYLFETRHALGCVPSTTHVVAERFFDESGGMQLVLHTPFGARINRAWGLSLRKRFCVTFDFELQAAATDDGLVLSLGEQHSFPLESALSYVKSASVEETLVQALLTSPLFTTRWRWNAARALTVLRYSGGRRVPMPITRMRCEDLMAAVFPEQIACQENISGPITPPDHPLVNQTIHDCLHEAMDLEGLRQVLGRLERGEIKSAAIETPTPSPMSHEILNSNPYAFLDDAPLEERRAKAVSLRRLDPSLSTALGVLDVQAIEEVRRQAWPDIRDADELHDALLTLKLLPVGFAEGWDGFAQELTAVGRVVVGEWTGPEGELRRAYVAAESAGDVRAAVEDISFDRNIGQAFGAIDDSTKHEAIREMLRGWMQHIGPTTSAWISKNLSIDQGDVERALVALEGSGAILRGRFTAGAEQVQWCERHLLARIHRLTIGRLRREIEPVTPAQFMRFLFRWHHLHSEGRLHGKEGVAQVIGQLQGLELPAPAWEEHVLPARIHRYDPDDLEYLCLSGAVAWGRLGSNNAPPRTAHEDAVADHVLRRLRTGRNSPLGFVMRDSMQALLHAPVDGADVRELSPAAIEVLAYLQERGASFLADIEKGTRRLSTEVHDALWELVAHGAVTGDGIAGLRFLLKAGHKRAARPRMHSVGRRTGSAALSVGRWSLWGAGEHHAQEVERDEAIARQLLRRYGVVFRDVLARERIAPTWRILLGIYRRFEARGEIRGGRFVSGFVGEQFALPIAVETLRAVRREQTESEQTTISASDPLNLVGIIVPGGRVSPFSGLSIAFRNGVFIGAAPLGTLRARLWNETGQSAFNA